MSSKINSYCKNGEKINFGASSSIITRSADTFKIIKIGVGGGGGQVNVHLFRFHI